jgi:hypothetical protein
MSWATDQGSDEGSGVEGASLAAAAASGAAAAAAEARARRRCVRVVREGEVVMVVVLLLS